MMYENVKIMEQNKVSKKEQSNELQTFFCVWATT